MLTRAHRQEALSRTYVQAIAAQAGLIYGTHEHDYGIDVSLRATKTRGSRRLDAGIVLDLQLKSTTQANVSATHVSYDLEVKTYDDLRDPEARCPRILVVLVLPDEEARWLSQSEEELIVRNCAYWLSLANWAPTTSKATVRVPIPRVNIFSVLNLRALFERIRTGGEP